MGYYTNYSMEVIDIDNKGYDAYKIAKYMLEKMMNLKNFILFSMD